MCHSFYAWLCCCGLKLEQSWPFTCLSLPLPPTTHHLPACTGLDNAGKTTLLTLVRPLWCLYYVATPMNYSCGCCRRESDCESLEIGVSYPLLYIQLKTGEVGRFIPTQRAHVDEVVLGNTVLKAWDLGKFFTE
jgi:hypothetical protein